MEKWDEHQMRWQWTTSPVEEAEDSRGDVSHRQLDTDRGEAGLRVLEVVATLTGGEATDPTPIHDTVDRLLSELFANPPSPALQAKVEFLYEGYRINVYQDGQATFVEIPDETT